MKNIDIPKTASIDKLSGRFLKDDTEILSKLSEICNLSFSHRIFLYACKVEKLKPIFKQCKKSTHIILSLSRNCH